MNEPTGLEPALELITRPDMEGLRLRAYKDGGGIMTIGYGTTHVQGRPVPVGMTCTKEQAYQWCLDDCLSIAAQIKRWVTKPLNENQLCALTSLCYNIGLGNFHESSILHLINSGAAAKEVAVHFGRFIHDVKGNIEPGLVRRRGLEAAMFLKAPALQPGQQPSA